jgi:hypothetical protein
MIVHLRNSHWFTQDGWTVNGNSSTSISHGSALVGAGRGYSTSNSNIADPTSANGTLGGHGTAGANGGPALARSGLAVHVPWVTDDGFECVHRDCDGGQAVHRDGPGIGTGTAVGENSSLGTLTIVKGTVNSGSRIRARNWVLSPGPEPMGITKQPKRLPSYFHYP